MFHYVAGSKVLGCRLSPVSLLVDGYNDMIGGSFRVSELLDHGFHGNAHIYSEKQVKTHNMIY